MGCFDSVIVRCPKCGQQNEFQSKAGKCLLKRYGVNGVPIEIAQNLNGDTETCSCGTKLKLLMNTTVPLVVSMFVVPIGEDEDDSDLDLTDPVC